MEPRMGGIAYKPVYSLIDEMKRGCVYPDPMQTQEGYEKSLKEIVVDWTTSSDVMSQGNLQDALYISYQLGRLAERDQP